VVRRHTQLPQPRHFANHWWHLVEAVVLQKQLLELGAGSKLQILKKSGT
jgi:hypothetical protein